MVYSLYKKEQDVIIFTTYFCYMNILLDHIMSF